MTNTHGWAVKTLLAKNDQLLELRLATDADLVDDDDNDNPDEEGHPGLWARTRRWFARLFGRA
jgi:hypothetical protein